MRTHVIRYGTASATWWASAGLAAVLLLAHAPSARAQTAAAKPDFPPHASVLEGFEKVDSRDENGKAMFSVWVRKKDSQVFAELPANFATKKYFIALTVASGERFAGLQAGDVYVYWRRYNDRLALISPNVATRSNGDAESKASVKRLFTDTVILDVPIATIGPGGGPVVDLDALLVGRAQNFFGANVFNRDLIRLVGLKQTKVFAENIELAFEIPTRTGKLQSLYYSISELTSDPSYKPRTADERVGYFVTAFSDLGIYSDDKTRVRYINRWHLEKRDASLKISPPKNPIVFYIEHTTPVRYRRWVREGILSWNKAFEKVGLSDAIEVYYQDAQTGAHMDKDPEDVRYNFVRWLNNDMGTAIGPSRVDPLTGQILDADIILTDGWIRHFRFQFDDLLPKLAMEGFSPETLAWLSHHPAWDPRLRLASPAQRPHLMQELLRNRTLPYGGHPLAQEKTPLIGDEAYDGLVGRASQINGMCLAAEGKAFDIATLRMSLDLIRDQQAQADAAQNDGDKKDDKEEKKEEKKDEKKEPKKEENLLDGMPEEFIGPLLAHLVAHEVGHTLGLRHNFKASGIYSLDEINSQKLKGKSPWAGSVMDYTPVNIRVKSGKLQGDFTMLQIGPYDEWAIEYGYTFEKDLKPILKRVSEPELIYATDEDTFGPDPLARRYDFSKNPLDYARDQMELANYHRGRLLKEFVKDGDSWAKARRGYELTLSMQTRSLSMMANWLGGVFVSRAKKGDSETPPLQVVPVQQQREALQFVIDNAFQDKAFGLTPELLQHLSVDKWLDSDSHSAMGESTWPVHDRIMGIQSSALTMIVNPTTLRRVYDNELAVPADQDMVTLAEVLDSVHTAIWSELSTKPDKKYSPRQPLISSLRRNLQREHVERLIDLSLPGSGGTEAFKPVSNLALGQLRSIRSGAEQLLKDGGDNLDPYTRAHLTELQEKITKALDSIYIYNANAMGGGGMLDFLFLKEPPKNEAPLHE